MTKAFFTAVAASLSTLTLASVTLASELVPAQTHVTIRGSGNNVTLERSSARAAAPSFEKPRAEPAVLAEAAQLKAKGFDDATVIDYLRIHKVDLPNVIELDSVWRLRKAGAGESVISYLSSVAALDVGPTAERGGSAASSSPEGESDYVEPYGHAADGGYSLGGGYASTPYFGRFGSRGLFPDHRFVFHARHPFFSPGFPKFSRMPMPVHAPMPPSRHPGM